MSRVVGCQETTPLLRELSLILSVSDPENRQNTELNVGLNLFFPPPV